MPRCFPSPGTSLDRMVTDLGSDDPPTAATAAGDLVCAIAEGIFNESRAALHLFCQILRAPYMFSPGVSERLSEYLDQMPPRRLFREFACDVNLTGVRLQHKGIDFTEATLIGANFTKAQLDGQKLVNTTLTGTLFTGALCRGMTFSGGQGTGARFPGADCDSSTFQGGFSAAGADFSGAYLGNTTWTGVRLVGANVAGSSWHGAKLLNVDLRGANLVGANLSGSTLQGVDFRGANLTAVNFVGTEYWADINTDGAVGADFIRELAQR